MIKPIAFYLPQFHSIPENDSWWEPSFTEWTNVTKAKSQYPGHYQPILPSELGFYDLRLIDNIKKQIELAREYLLYGFCFYYYNFSGKRLLEKPLDLFYYEKTIDFPFMICWANENWTRRWDGRETDILIRQNYNSNNEIIIENISNYLKDPRYIRINNKLFLIIYRVEDLPDVKSTIDYWRQYVFTNLREELFIGCINNFTKNIDPKLYNLDLVIQFTPDIRNNLLKISSQDLVDNYGFSYENSKSLTIYDYDMVNELQLSYDYKSTSIIRGAFPCWDNTARRGNNSTIIINSSPEKFHNYLNNSFIEMLKNYRNIYSDYIFINAWNEWAEGAILEPDSKNGRGNLIALKNALLNSEEIKKITNNILNNNLPEKYIDRKYIIDIIYKSIETNVIEKRLLVDRHTIEIQLEREKHNREIDKILNSKTMMVGKIISKSLMKLKGIIY